MNLEQIREQYPQYQDMSDEDLARGLHAKFYSDMPFDEFAAKVGYQAQPVAPQEPPSLYRRITDSAPVQRAADLATGINRGFLGMLDLPGHLVHAVIPGEGPEEGFFTQAGRSAGLLREPTDTTGQVLSRIGQEVGASAPVLGLTLQAAKTVPAIAQQGGNVLKQLARSTVQAARQSPLRFAGAEAGLSTVSGAGAAGAQQLFPDNPYAELAGQMLPTLGPAMFAGVARRLLRGGEAGRQAVEDSLDTFARAGTTPTVGQATGNRLYQAGETISNSLPGGGPIAAAGERQAAQIGSRVDDLARSISPRVGSEQAGRAIERGITGEGGFLSRFRARAGDLFNNVDRYIPQTKPVGVGNTQKTLESLNPSIAGAEETSKVLANPKIAQIKQAFLTDAGDAGVMPYAALKALRSQVGDMMASTDLIADAPRAQLKRIYGALSQDMRAAAQAQGPEAMRAFERANKYYSAGIDRVDDILQRVVNKTNLEDIFSAATRGKEGATTVRAVMRSLKPDERDIVAATMMKRLGRANPSAQDDLGEAFSPETFLTNWNRLAPEARRALFSGSTYRGLHDDLSAIAKAASQIREGSRVLANPSGTASRSANLAATGAGLLGAYTGNLDAVGILVAGAISNNAAARLLTNPRTVQWLARSTRIPPERLGGYLARLSQIGQRDPEIAPAVEELVTAIQQGQTVEQSTQPQ